MSGGEAASNSTPPTPVSSTSLHTLSPFLPQAAAGIGRYPIYAAAVPAGNSLFCSPTGLFSHPWRGISLSGTTTTSTVTQQQPPQQQQQATTNTVAAAAAGGGGGGGGAGGGGAGGYMSLTQLAQLHPGLVCAPLGTIFPTTQPSTSTGSPSTTPDSSAKRNHGSEHPGKRRSESSHYEMEAMKRPRIAELAQPRSPSLASTSSSTSSSSSSSSSHHASSTIQHKPHPQQQQSQQQQQQQQQQQRSPIFKVIPYPSPAGGQIMLQATPTASIPQAIVVPASSLTMSPIAKQQQQQQQQQSQTQKKVIPLSHSQHARLSPSLVAQGGGVGGGVTVSDPTQPLRNNIAVAAAAAAAVNSPNTGKDGVQSARSSAAMVSKLTKKLRIVLLKCFGPVTDSVVSQNHLVVSNFLQDIYRQSYFTTSNCSDLPLSPESCCLLTICYLSSLQRGERISVENLRTMIHYAQLGELDWLQYYKKHKKMSESTFVQAQLIHLSRVAVYPVLGKVRIIISSQSLSDGILTTLQNMVQLLASPEQVLPEYWVVLAVRPSSTIDFCVLAVDPLQAQVLYELKLLNLDKRSRKQQQQQPTKVNVNNSRFPNSCIGHYGTGTRRSPTPNSHSAVSNTATTAAPTALLASNSNSKLSLSRDLLFQVQVFQQKLGGKVLIPFCQPDMIQNQDNLLAGLGLLLVDRKMADKFVPSFSYLVEHKPRGPFQDQYNVAMHMLQKVLSNWGGGGAGQEKLENFRKVDFRVLVPSEASFVSQTVTEVIESGVLTYLQAGQGDREEGKGAGRGEGGSRGSLSSSSSVSSCSDQQREVEDRVVCCGNEKDAPRFRAMLSEMAANKDVLYVVVAENGHMTNNVSTPETPPSSSSSSSSSVPSPDSPNYSYSDSVQLLCGLPNCLLINVSSHPYTLQTNRSFISFSNEIHWPATADKTGLHFCSAGDFKTDQFQNLDSEFEYGVRFRDDQCFEEMFHEAVTNLGPSACPPITILRGQLLLNQYISALLGTVGKNCTACPATPANFASPKTQVIFDQLVYGPLKNPRGHGCMVLVRSHDKSVGKEFYQNLVAVRDSLGLSHRFEILYDDGSQYLTIADHFHRRLSHWKGKHRVNGMRESAVGVAGGEEDMGGASRTSSGRHMIMSYKELENLPCLVILAGEARAGLSFPSTLWFVDLRLCYPIGNVTRHQYEYDTSFFNGYYKVLTKSSPTPDLTCPRDKERSNAESVPMEPNPLFAADDSDSEVFDGTSPSDHTLAPSASLAARTNSSSSSRKSSYEDLGPGLVPCDDGVKRPSSSLDHNAVAMEISGVPVDHVGTTALSPPQHPPPTMVEWRPHPQDEMMAGNGDSPHPHPHYQQAQNGFSGNGTNREGSNSDAGGDGTPPPPQEDLKALYGSAVTVTIDPPRDDCNDEVASYLEGGRSAEGRKRDGSTTPQTQEEQEGKRQSLADLFDGESDMEGEGQGEEFDLFKDLDDVDLLEEDENEPPPPTKICLLSKPYYYIWFSRSLQQHLLLQPSAGVSWHGGYKRPPLFEMDSRQQSAHYRKWTKPALREVRSQYDSIMKEANKSSRKRFLLTGPSQVGKTGAWLLMIRLLHDHLRSSQGVLVENLPVPLSMFLPPVPPRPLKGSVTDCLTDGVPQNHFLVSSSSKISSASSKHSRIVPLEYLHSLLKGICDDETKSGIKVASPDATPIQSSAEASSSSSSSLLAPASGGFESRHDAISLTVSQYMSYDFAHSCNECSKYVQGNRLTLPEFLTFTLPVQASGHAPFTESSNITMRLCVPPTQLKHCVISANRKSLERLKLPSVRTKGDKVQAGPLTPIFTPTFGRDSSGLFNLYHNMFHQLHILVTSESEFGKYCKAWPNHIVMALPDQQATGLGSVYYYIKQFAQYNWKLNVAAQTDATLSRVLWPFIAIISDNVVMCRKFDPDSNSSVDISLSSALQLYEQATECLHYTAMSALPWSKEMENSQGSTDKLTDYDLSHDFVLLNLAKTADISYNQFSFNSAEVDFNLQLKACQCRTKLRKDLTFVRKCLPSGGNPYPLRSEVSGLCSEVDKLVISLHHDSSSHLPHPGPYLMEHYLFFKGQALFPYAQSPQFPVLAVDNYISLGPQTHLSFIKSEMLRGDGDPPHQNGELPPSAFAGLHSAENKTVAPFPLEDLSKIRFGGLLLYLCEEKLSSEHLKKLNFVTGASLCLVTQDCKTLVREVARLDLEGGWKFRLRDEYQTACADDMTPLFFLIGRFEGQS